MFDDKELRNRVIAALERDTRVDEKEVNVKVENGAVFLEGVVDSAAERRAVESDAQSVPGITTVVGYLQLRNYIDRTDEELVQAVKQDLLRDPYVDPSNIEIQANHGAVLLNGRVKTHAEKHSAVNVALWTPGVTDVTDALNVDEEERHDAEEPDW